MDSLKKLIDENFACIHPNFKIKLYQYSYEIAN